MKTIQNPSIQAIIDYVTDPDKKDFLLKTLEADLADAQRSLTCFEGTKFEEELPQVAERHKLLQNGKIVKYSELIAILKTV